VSFFSAVGDAPACVLRPANATMSAKVTTMSLNPVVFFLNKVFSFAPHAMTGDF
jgi:hypothetical protein